MRVLFVTHRFPGLAMRGDQQRAFEHLRALGPHHAITLVASDETAPTEAARAAIAPYCARIVFVPRSRVSAAWRALRALPGERSLQQAWCADPALHRALHAEVATQAFDLAHVQLVRLADSLPALRPLPVAVDLVDALSLNMRRRAALDAGPMAWLARIEAARIARSEAALLQSARAVAVSAAADRAALPASPHVHLVGNGVDADRFPFRSPEHAEARVVFVGNLSYFPNLDALRWFIAEVWPIVRARCPDAVLDLVGAHPPRSLARLAAAVPGVHLVGGVDSVVPWLHRAAVAVVPMRAGSGQQIKLIEAMSAGTPVVASERAASALGLGDGEALRVADAPSAQAEAIVGLLSDPAARVRQALHARDRVLAAHTWSQSALALARMWQSALG